MNRRWEEERRGWNGEFQGGLIWRREREGRSREPTSTRGRTHPVPQRKGFPSPIDQTTHL